MTKDDRLQKIQLFRILKYVAPLGLVIMALLATQFADFDPEMNRMIVGAAFVIGLIDFFVFGWLEARARSALR